MAELMDAVVFRRAGGPEVLKLARLARPRPHIGEILVQVHAASVNPADDKMRASRVAGAVLRRLHGQAIPGMDFAGTVVALGRGTSRFDVGDPVYGALRPPHSGSYAGYIRVPETWAAPMPNNLTFEEAASLPVVGLTALQLLRDKARVQAGERVLVNGASGGVGTMAVQIARIYGCHVTGVCSTRHMETVYSLGAERVVDYTREVVAHAGHFDVVVDTVSKLSLDTVRQLLAPYGRYVATLPRRDTLLYKVTGRLSAQHQATRFVAVRPDARDLNLLRRWVEEGRLRPVVEHVVPLARAADAHREVHAGHSEGKVVLAVLHGGSAPLVSA
ncbi:MAG: NAD(P)-dependent alcohol dehydrogenase [Myxococcaceae bacterium]|nr:NAD(P)-dependent alcohol dehydrogenase [Myxococcaceae bacterium]MCI0673223.1 NAD(P)-dependent alcohol dehydrogenase [Myxococcaceae bacterium]